MDYKTKASGGEEIREGNENKRDLLEFLERVSGEKMEAVFISDWHKRAPPIGLGKNMNMIKAFVPKILDMKRETGSPDDTFRQLRSRCWKP